MEIYKKEVVKKANMGKVKDASKALALMRKEISKVFFGQEKIVDSLLRALLCNGHILLEGVPGIAKTLLIKTLAEVSGCSFKRIQFTADLLPSDIVGITAYDPKKGFEVIKGPIFSNFIIADEINRSPPKTQSALIEAMQEGQVTIGSTTYPLPTPFFVMANQNPIETEGVYALPEAQIDRFLFKILMEYPDDKSELHVMEENATFKKFEDYKINSIVTAEKIKLMQQLTHEIYLDEKIKDYILAIIKKTRDKKFKYGEYIDLGCSPRGSIALYIGAKAEALVNGRNFVIPSDVKAVAKDILRHRIILAYKAQADKITPEIIIEEIFKEVHAK